MDERVKAELEQLQLLNPTNLHLLTNATYSERITFESLWSHHGPMAARYSLLPALHEGKLQLCETQAQ